MTSYSSSNSLIFHKIQIEIMGNIEGNKTPKQIPMKLQRANQLPSNSLPKQASLKPGNKKIAKALPMFKAQFHKISPIDFPSQSSSVEPEEIEDEDCQQMEVEKEQTLVQKKSIIEEIIENAPKEHERIEVNWAAFTKIKKKNYLQEYSYNKEIGRGTFGVVVKAKMKYAKRYRAIKIIKESCKLTNESNKKKLLAEISIPMELDHPNLSKVYEVFQWKTSLAIVMELCQGGDLFSFIKNQRKFTQSTASSIVKQIMSGVYYMHKQGICHRDLKPENILYDNSSQNGSLKIIDFGSAVRVDPFKPLTALIGTPFYIAPEILQGKYNQLCDVWSCGVILYIILSGSPPFPGKNQNEIFDRIKSCPINFNQPIWAKRSVEVKTLLKKMLTKNPLQRITAEQVLNSPWFQKSIKGSTANAEIGQQIISNLKNFHFQNKLKAVVYTFIASQLYENKDKENLLRAFREIDKDGDGVIEREELVDIFNTTECSLPVEEIEAILKIIDTNGSGRIDFTQFLVAASNEEQLLKRKQLENAFNYLDTDHSGFITIDEVKAFLDGSEETGEEIKEIFNQVDENGDGEISKNQFISLLLNKNKAEE